MFPFKRNTDERVYITLQKVTKPRNNNTDIMCNTVINVLHNQSSECSQYKLMKVVTNIQINPINLFQNSNTKQWLTGNIHIKCRVSSLDLWLMF